MRGVWQTRCLDYRYYCLWLMALLLPLTETGTDSAYVLAVLFAVLSGVVWQQRVYLYRHPVNMGLLALLMMIVLGLLYSNSWMDGATWWTMKHYLWLALTPLLLVTAFTPAQRSRLLHAFLWGNALVLVVSLSKVVGAWWQGEVFFIGVFRNYLMQNFFMAFASCFLVDFCDAFCGA